MTLIIIGLGWVIGLVPVGAWGSPWWMGAAWLLVSAPGMLVAGPVRGRYVLVGAAIFAAAAAGWRLHAASGEASPSWARLAGSEVVVTGTVASEPDRGLTVTGYVIKVSSVASAGAPVDSGGKVLVYLNQYDRYLPGDRLTLRGELDQPVEGESSGYRAYLARRGIAATVYRPAVLEAQSGGTSVSRWLTRQRLAFDRALQRSLPEPEASLAGGIAFGRDDGLSPDLAGRFNSSGLRHLVAVSGSNVTLVAALMYVLCVPLLGRRWAWAVAGLAIVAYLGAAGLAPSVIRAGIMALTFLLGAALGRPQSGLPALFAAVIVMTAWSPGLATNPGFLLSATATGGILMFYPLLAGWLRKATSRRWTAVPHWVVQAGALTLASTISTLPVMWSVFGRVSLVSPLANIVVEPLFVLAFWGSIATAVVARLNADLGVVMADAAYYPLAAIVWCARSFGSMPGASIDVPGGVTTLALAAYAVLTPVGLFAYRFAPRTPEEPRAVQRRRVVVARAFGGACAGATLVAIVPVSLLSRPGDGDLTVRFFDVGQGDAAFLTTPHGRQVLIDGGPSGLGLAGALSGSMPHWDRSLDLVILSHPQEDHMAGLPEIASRYTVARVLDNGWTNATRTFEYFRATTNAEALSAGDAFTVDAVRFEVLWPPAGYSNDELNDTSLVIRVSYRDVSFLFTGDSEAAVHQALMASGDVHADVLKVPHHGSRTTDPRLFSAVSPALAVISVGADNIFGHPHPDTLAALEGYNVVRTDESGTVTVRTDGQSLRVSTAR